MEFDHLAISTTSLGEGVEAVEEALGVPLAPGGEHPFMGTHNRLLSLGAQEYLEVIAINPDAPAPGRPRWFDLDNFPGITKLTNWVMRCVDLDAALDEIVPDAHIAAQDLARGEFRWRMGIPEDGKLPFEGAIPALIEWQGPHPAAGLPDQDCHLHRLVIAHPEARLLRNTFTGVFHDPRIIFEDGPHKELRAEIRTPAGLKILE